MAPTADKGCDKTVIYQRKGRGKRLAVGERGERNT